MNEYLNNFNQVIKENFDEFLCLNGFKLESKMMKEYFCKRIYRKGELYISITATIHQQDYPQDWMIALGKGNATMPESDWNAVALWQIMERLGQTTPKYYSLSKGFGKFIDTNELSENIQSGKNDLENFGKSFLEGDLKIFYEVRNTRIRSREPMKMSIVDNNGNYKLVDAPESLELKKRFTGENSDGN